MNDFKVGDEVWWFKMKAGCNPPNIELVHDIVQSIEEDGYLICNLSSHVPQGIWGKTREEAFARLKTDLEQWGKLE